MATKIGTDLEIGGAHVRAKFHGYWDSDVAWYHHMYLSKCAVYSK